MVLAAIYIFFLNISFDKSSLINLSEGRILVIGHAGLGFISWVPFNPYPSNSFIAIKKAIEENNADGVEVDVHMTKDEHFVLFHDEKLNKNSNLKGCISQKNLVEVLNGNYNVSWPFDWFQNENIITLDSLVGYFKTLEKFPILQLDIRNKSVCLTNEENVEWEKEIAYELIKKLNRLEVPQSKILIISFSKDFMRHLGYFKNPYPHSFEIVGDIEDGLKYAIESNCQSITVKPKLLSKELSARAHASGLKVITFGAKSKSGNKKLLQLNPDVIQTNNIDALNELMEY